MSNSLNIPSLGQLGTWAPARATPPFCRTISCEAKAAFLPRERSFLGTPEMDTFDVRNLHRETLSEVDLHNAPRASRPHFSPHLSGISAGWIIPLTKDRVGQSLDASLGTTAASCAKRHFGPHPGEGNLSPFTRFLAWQMRGPKSSFGRSVPRRVKALQYPRQPTTTR